VRGWRVARTVLVYLPAALVVAFGWLRLEQPHASGGTILWLVALALAPALGRRVRERVALAVVAAVLAAHTAFGVSILDARPFDGRHDFFGPLLGGFRDGFLDFYDFPLPIDPGAHPLMHGVLLAAAFGSCLALGLAIAARRAFVAVLVVVVAAGWPATLLGGGGELRRGALILGATLLVLAGLSARNALVPGRALVAGAAVVACALAASTSPAVAKPEFLNWQHWDFYTRPQKAVSVEYVWNSSYDGIRFPKKRTTVLSVKGPAQPLYWRATTLDVFNGRAWIEDRTQPLRPPGRDPLLPPGVASGKDLFREEITVRALRDRHLIGGSVPVGFEFPRALGNVRLLRSGTAIAARTLPRGGTYLAVSYAPQPTPATLAASEPLYPPELARYGYLDVQPGLAVPPFGVPGREARIRELFDLYRFDTVLSPYAALYAKAKAVVGHPSNPYGAALALETWFRTSGGFTYTERPGRAGEAPLVDFTIRTKRGYCQHFAGAMALMLRYLGIPTRVAAGFTSGTYDRDHGTWTVTDHDAHMWVEAWFDGYGWLPFDPTPSRGALSGSYTAASHNFDLSAARRLLTLAAAAVVGDPADYKQNNAFGEKGLAPTLGGAADARRAPATVPSSGTGAGASLLRLLVMIALVLLAGIVLAKLVLRQSRFLTKDPRRLATACRRDLADFLADQRVALPASATPAEVGAAVELEYPVDAQRFVDALTMARFGPEQGAAAHAGTARRELRRLEREIRRQLGMVERVLGLVSLRSLGFSG
jgi:transglutaminase-like putative cysteine protease